MRGGTLWILGLKGQGQIWHSVYKTFWTRYSLKFLPNHFQTSQLLMMRGGTIFISVHGVKGQCHLWHFVYKTLWAFYRLHFLPNHFQTLQLYSITGSKVKVNFGTLSITPCGHDTDQFLTDHFQIVRINHSWWLEET